MLNDDTLKQFFIQGFFKAGTIRGVLERNPRTLVDAKKAARDIENIDKDYEKLWRKEDESIPQFIPIRPKILDRELGENGDHVSQSTTDLSSRPLALKEPVPLLLLPAPYEDSQLEDVERSFFWTVQESESLAKTSKSIRIAQRVGQRLHASRILPGVGGGNVRALRKRQRQKRVCRHCNTKREQTRTITERLIDIDSMMKQIEDMALPKKSDKVRKLIPLKVPYEELRPFRRELIK
ncbi:hypothetical protein AXG93_1939s1060 [Marchantia polymorpha subsp. ruderalis]|uniref:Uncharacterized protein n=1 Tax=Marchantia polymorpha subsp. ruderalis TaxID=1480154 RepID=A0A176VW58_MARPO|nr:hypothetical protein AXG93_1939s1060 [Marchantia polymorpha subsp. ruderalis]